MAGLDKAIACAAAAHVGQKDKAGKPYILHPIRVMMQMKTETEQIIAILHDVLEDTDCTTKALKQQGFSSEIINAVLTLTRSDKDSYEDYINRIKKESITKRVKLADLSDNMNISRISSLRESDVERVLKYHRAWVELQV